MRLPYRFTPAEPDVPVLRTVCHFAVLDVGFIYATLLGIIGVGLSGYDVINLLKPGNTLPCSLWRTRIKSGCIVSFPCERDLKLISLILSTEYYLLLIIGTLTKNSLLFLPWLFFHSIVIVFEFLVFISRLYLEGVNLGKGSILLSIFVVYNWLAIFCLYGKLSGYCV